MSSEGPVLVLNAGSSSLKYQLLVPETGEVLAKGLVERIGEPGGAADHTAAMTEMSTALADAGIDLASAGLRAVGHRVVHGGPDFSDPVIITDAVVAEISDLIPLAPLHNPGAVAGIEAARAEFDVPHVAVFDTAFFATLPPAAATYADPGRPGAYAPDPPLRLPRHLAPLRLRGRGGAGRPAARRAEPDRAAPGQRLLGLGRTRWGRDRDLDGADAAAGAGDGHSLG